jgi:hypothetical protein
MASLPSLAIKFIAESPFMTGIEMTDTRAKHVRAKLSNDLFALPGVDGRSARARRYRDLMHDLIAEFGIADPRRLRDLAGLRFTLEQCQASIVGGGASTLEDLVRMTNAIGRKERELRASKRAETAAKPSLADYLADTAEEDAA